MTIPEAFQVAVQHHQDGRLAEAEALYRQILAVDPRQPDSIHMLGLIANQVGRNDVAVDLIRQAIAIAPEQPAFHSNLGNALGALGRLDEAVVAYRRAIQIQPDFADAHNNLGSALKTKGDLDGAIAAYQRALQCRPDVAEIHANLGSALCDCGRLDEAVAACRRAQQLRPDFAEAFNHLGIALSTQGKPDEAIAAYRQAIRCRPDFATAHNNLGNALGDSGRRDEAIGAYRQAIQLQADFAAAHHNLGIVLTAEGRLDEAVAAFHRALRIQPDYAEAHCNLGHALSAQGRFDEAVAAFRSAVRCKPDFATAHNNLGSALQAQGRIGEAIAACRRALELAPDFAEAHSNLGISLNALGQIDEAAVSFRRALQCRPDFADALSDLGSTYKNAGQVDEAIAYFRRALSLAPHHSGIHGNLIYTLHFHPGRGTASIAEEHRRWEHEFAEPLQKFHRPHANDRDLERRLRIGYVSPDFWRHVICHFLLPLLEAHDHAGFEIFCYASVKRPDAITARMKKNADVWREVLGVSHEALAERIREDKIDILVDLTQHMGDNRLPVFARKPAPVQVAWLGYPGSTGLSTMDYRLTDAQMEPEGSPWSESVEQVVRLPDSWFCFDPIDEFPEPGTSAAQRSGHVTFGCLNNLCKVNEAVVRLWSRVMLEVEGSRLLLQCPAGETQAHVRQWFAAHGIAADRLELVARTSTRAEFLKLFARMDIALDPFPYNGGTTTAEALWMGVPVLTLPGELAIARIGLSILTACGMPEFVAHTEEEYVRLAAALAADLPRLSELRARLRARMKASAFMDGPRFAKNVEHAFRAMWRAWCAKQNCAQTP